MLGCPNLSTTLTAPQKGNIKVEPDFEPGYQTYGPAQGYDTHGPTRGPNQIHWNQGQTPVRSASYSALTSKVNEWLSKSLYFDPSKTKWEAFYFKFDNYAKQKRWSSQECKSNLIYVLEGKAAEFYASLHEKESDLPYYDVIRRMEARFSFRELQETSQLAFLKCIQTKEEKVEE